MLLELQEVNKIARQKVAPFNFKELDGQYLITSDLGEFSFLNPQSFRDYLSGLIEKSNPLKYSELRTKGFVRDYLDLNGLGQKYAKKNAFLCKGPGLHIVVVTLRCDHKCVYCQTGSRGLDSSGLDMDIPTAKKVVDAIFESPGESINLEIQGGEPLVNWGTVKFILEYAKKKNTVARKNLFFSLVSNFTFMDEERLGFLIKNNVGICTSLDGPQALHNKNRISLKTNSHRKTVEWIKRIQSRIKKDSTYTHGINALATVTRFSLAFSKQIVDEYAGLGFEGVHLRPANPFGVNKKVWDKISFSPEQFLAFYRISLDYIIELNLSGKNFYERTAKIFLTKILTDSDPNFLDIRSPCGAVNGQVAYNFDGNVYTCDEGRMVSMAGDESFCIGNISKNSYKEMINSDVTKVMHVASCLENLPGCSECVYKPYCGVCPIYNYVAGGSLFMANTLNDRCRIHMGILDYIFLKLQEKKSKEVFDRWVKPNKTEGESNEEKKRKRGQNTRAQKRD